MSANIFRYRNIEHEMRCVHAIRERRKVEAMAVLIQPTLLYGERIR